MIEKIISRLENRKNFCERDWENYHIEHDFGAMLAYQTAIDIVQEVAKDGGWIPCSGCKDCQHKECEHHGKV